MRTKISSDGAQMFSNRLQKNLKRFKKWRAREKIQCYRLYDADLPEYAMAIDIYQGAKRWVHVQEYSAPKSIDEKKASIRRTEALQVIEQDLGVGKDQLFFKMRQQQKGSEQYQRLATKNEFHEVSEGDCRFLLNFQDYLDTGLFLDHRNTRTMLAVLASAKHFLNLFAYTGSASVYAAKGGALSTTTVDMSNTYLNWAKRNMNLNGFEGQQHKFIQEDCLQWVVKAAGKRQFGLIFLDPPSFSASKRMKKTFDVQRDHVALIINTMKLLQPTGILIFSNNLRSFKMDSQSLAEFTIKDISKSTLPKDFERNPRIHNCWRICRQIETSDKKV